MESRPWHRHYEPGVPTSIRYEDLTVPAYLERAALEWGDRPALAFLNCAMDYRELKERTDRFATALHGLGVGRGSRVAIHLPNLPQTVIAIFAVLRLGAHAVMTNPLYTPREIEHQWNDAGCEIAITTDWLWAQKLRGMRERLPVKEYVIAGIAEYLRFPLNLLAPLKLRRMDPPMTARWSVEPRVHPFRRLLEAAAAAPPAVAIGMDDVAVIQYTGGTTGLSKGAMLTHRNLSYNVQQCSAWFTGLEPGHEVILTALPMFHIFGLTICTMWPVAGGAKLVLQANPRDIPLLVKNVVKHRITLFPAVPALFNAINQFPGVEKLDLSSVKYCFSGSAPLPEDVQSRFESLTGATIAEGFGLTETSPVATVNPLRGLRKIGHIGVPVPDTDARVVDADDDRRVLPPGEAGELLLKGPQIMLGYLNRPEETAAMLRDGWLHTGDLAVMDADGFFKIVGRKKDMILCSGFNVYPDEIDRVLMAHPKVFEACTIGVPDEKRGETVMAFVVPQPGHSVTVAELDAWCREQLASYKVPHTWEFRSELPKSSMMKLLRRVLRDEQIAKQKQHV